MIREVKINDMPGPFKKTYCLYDDERLAVEGKPCVYYYSDHWRVWMTYNSSMIVGFNPIDFFDIIVMYDKRS